MLPAVEEVRSRQTLPIFPQAARESNSVEFPVGRSIALVDRCASLVPRGVLCHVRQWPHYVSCSDGEDQMLALALWSERERGVLRSACCPHFHRSLVKSVFCGPEHDAARQELPGTDGVLWQIQLGIALTIFASMLGGAKRVVNAGKFCWKQCVGLVVTRRVRCFPCCWRMSSWFPHQSVNSVYMGVRACNVRTSPWCNKSSPKSFFFQKFLH